MVKRPMAHDDNTALAAQLWQPSPQTVRYDRPRVEQLLPIKTALETLGLPLLRLRKLKGIVNALEMQIEDWGDSPEVNRLLLDALRAALRFQVTEQQARPMLQAIEAFQQQENQHWERMRAGKPPPIILTPIEALDELMQQGYQLLKVRREAEACERWLETWEWVKRLAEPQMESVRDFDHRYRGELMQLVFNWRSDYSVALHNAGLTEPCYQEQRLRFVREYLALFPKESSDNQVTFRRDEAEALLALGRQSEAEALLTALVERYPTHGWAYIGWSDFYWLYRESPTDYARAEQILRLALDRPDLEDRDDVLSRIEQLDKKRHQPPPPAIKPKPAESSLLAPQLPLPGLSGGLPASHKLGRNDFCWCGSGKKYKNCHLGKDRA